MPGLVAAVADGDRRAFARLFDHFAPRVAAYLVRVGSSAETAEELAQEALVALWRKAGTFDPAAGSVQAWLFAIARNLRIDRNRREAGEAAGFDFDPSELPEPVPSPEEELQAQQVDRRVRAALGRLPPAQSRVVHLFYFAERPHPDIARDLSLPLGTVKSHIRRAVDNLRRLLETMDA